MDKGLRFFISMLLLLAVCTLGYIAWVLAFSEAFPVIPIPGVH